LETGFAAGAALSAVAGAAFSAVAGAVFAAGEGADFCGFGASGNLAAGSGNAVLSLLDRAEDCRPDEWRAEDGRAGDSGKSWSRSSSASSTGRWLEGFVLTIVEGRITARAVGAAWRAVAVDFEFRCGGGAIRLETGAPAACGLRSLNGRATADGRAGAAGAVRVATGPRAETDRRSGRLLSGGNAIAIPRAIVTCCLAYMCIALSLRRTFPHKEIHHYYSTTHQKAFCCTRGP
jgi:hypothetical protein